ncbi:MAG: mechanosensitive ion channel family protein [Bacteroidales bacterium]|nr:mechanosensitive ion channel family protein [Bacteroidales bacterium]
MKIENYYIEIIETLAVIIILFVVKTLISFLLAKIFKKLNLKKLRFKTIKKSINILLFLLTTIIIFLIWGIDQGELVLFVSSLLTILGIALFAQWSILSNITASVILFVNHPARIGDKIEILDKEAPLKGEIMDIGIFFIIIKTEDNEKVTIPTSLILQKSIKILSQKA